MEYKHLFFFINKHTLTCKLNDIPIHSYVLLEDKATHDVYICENSFADKLVSILEKDLFQLAVIKGIDSIVLCFY